MPTEETPPPFCISSEERGGGGCWEGSRSVPTKENPLHLVFRAREGVEVDDGCRKGKSPSRISSEGGGTAF